MADMLGMFILITIFMISLLAFMQSTGRMSTSLAASSFISFMIALLLRAMDIIPDLILYITMGVMALSAAMLFIKET